MKNVLIAGATGMVGSLILEVCLSSDEIAEVVVLTRKSLQIDHHKLREVIHADFSTYDSVREAFRNISVGFFCVGVYTGQVDDALFRKITVDFAVAFASTLKEESNDATLCLLSGAGADRTEKSSMSFAKYKGVAENKIAALNFTSWYSFRPGYIYPVIPRNEPNFMYKLSRWMYPLIKVFGKDYSIKSTELASAMVQVGLHGFDHEILENREILKLQTALN